jgi:hypothetical protein
VLADGGSAACVTPAGPPREPARRTSRLSRQGRRTTCRFAARHPEPWRAPVSQLDVNLALAERAVNFVKGLQIKSVNTPLPVAGLVLRALVGLVGIDLKIGALDLFLFDAMRFDMQNSPDKGHVANRKQILSIIRSGASKGEKKAKLKLMMNALGELYFDETTHRKPLEPDEQRIRAARKAVKFGYGNCWEKSALCATWLLENRPPTQSILWMDNNPAYDHCYVILGGSAGDVGQPYSTFPDEAVLVDGWSEDYYQLKSPGDLRYGVHVPNPFQTTVRSRVKAHGAQAVLKEQAHLNAPPRYEPNFRLELAAQANKSYRLGDIDLGEVAEQPDVWFDELVADLRSQGQEKAPGTYGI